MEGREFDPLAGRSWLDANVAARWISRNAAAIALSAAIAACLASGASAGAVQTAMAEAGGAVAAEQAAQPQSTAVFQKSEVVYADLDYAGTPVAAYVVNRFDVEQPGAVVDHGDYGMTKNLTNTDAIVFDEDATSMQLEEGVFFYQGNMEHVQLPWNISFEYALDGTPVEASELAGKSGKMSVTMRTAQNPEVDPAFFDSFMLQATFTLDSAKCSHVAAEGATIADAGADQTVAFTVLPGQDAAVTVSADVVDFAMAGVQVAGVAYSSPVEVPDTSAMTDGMQQLADGVSKVAGGSSSLAGGGSSLSQGADELSSGIAQVAEGADGLDAAGQSVAEGAQAIGQGISQQAEGLSQIEALLSSIDVTNMDAAEAAKLEMAKSALGKASAGMAALDGQYAAYESGVTKYVEGVGAITSGVVKLQSGADSLSSGVRSYVGGMDELNGGIQSLDSETSALPSTMRSEIDSMMADFDFPEFAPVSFVSAENQNVRSVQFVMTTPEIAVQDESQPVEPEPEETFSDRFLKLFR